MVVAQIENETSRRQRAGRTRDRLLIGLLAVVDGSHLPQPFTDLAKPAQRVRLCALGAAGERRDWPAEPIGDPVSRPLVSEYVVAVRKVVGVEQRHDALNISKTDARSHSCHVTSITA